MKKSRLRLSAKETDEFSHYLQNVLNKMKTTTFTDSLIRSIAINISVKLHTKSLMQHSANMLLSPEQAAALDYVILANPVPVEYVYTANVLRVVQGHLPGIDADLMVKQPTPQEKIGGQVYTSIPRAVANIITHKMEMVYNYVNQDKIGSTHAKDIHRDLILNYKNYESLADFAERINPNS